MRRELDKLAPSGSGLGSGSGSGSGTERARTPYIRVIRHETCEEMIGVYWDGYFLSRIFLPIACDKTTPFQLLILLPKSFNTNHTLLVFSITIYHTYSEFHIYTSILSWYALEAL